ncbi:MFS transporter [Kineosporia sp. NBRC 101731]|uniref:MFS transporter n=1 Tax=Kineosporia sp. NBRC 101731 TaxID=3032199 RepID=UPI0024A01C7F|nr:MFS transporter [Kineosporia sp. NBRC 101731]GLY28314.1 MFS transporter [Kineosporia sp. NBRC 101731]
MASARLSPYLTTLAGIVTLITLIAFEAVAVSTAMPVLTRDLNAVREIGFGFSVFIAAQLVGVVLSGSWCDTSGTRRPVTTGLVLFGGGQLICGFAPTFTFLLAGRALAGGGAGLLVVAMYVVIADVFPTRLQPRVFSLTAGAWVVPGIVGPALAGWLAEEVTWRLVFLLVVPLAVPPALALLPKLRSAPSHEPGDPSALTPSQVRRRAVCGVAVTAGVLGLQWGLARLGHGVVGGTVVVLALLLVVAGFRPLVPRGTLLLRRGLPTVIALRGLFAGMFFGAESFIPLMLINQHGFEAGQAGLVLTGGIVGWTAGSYVQARPWMPLPRHLLFVIGALIIATSLISLTLLIRPPVSGWLVLPLWAFCATGMGLSIASTGVLTLSYSEPGQEGRNSSALQLSDALGAALGIGVTGAAFAAWHDPVGGDARLFTIMWFSAGVFGVLVALAGFRARPT